MPSADDRIREAAAGLDDDDVGRRREAARTLFEATADSPNRVADHVGAFEDGLDDPDPLVRGHVAAVVGYALFTDPDRGVPEWERRRRRLLELLCDPDEGVRRTVLGTMLNSGWDRWDRSPDSFESEDRRLLAEGFVRCLGDDSDPVRDRAARLATPGLLAAHPEFEATALPTLVAALADPYGEVADDAADALWACATGEGAPRRDLSAVVGDLWDLADAGSDPVEGSAGSDPVERGAGSDPVEGSAGSQPSDGSAGSDPADGSTGSDPAGGSAGSDPVEGGAGSEPPGDDPATRRRALRVLAGVAAHSPAVDPAVLGDLLDALAAAAPDDPGIDPCLEAVERLVEGAPAGVEATPVTADDAAALVPYLAAPDEDTRRRAADALGALAREAPSAAPAVASTYADGVETDPVTDVADDHSDLAGRALEGILRSTARQGEDATTWRAESVLEAVVDAAPEAAARAVEGACESLDDDPAAWRAAVGTVGEVVADHPATLSGAVDPLLGAFSSLDGVVPRGDVARAAAAEAAVADWPAVLAHLPTVVEAAFDPTAGVRAAAAAALAEAAPIDSADAPDWVDPLADRYDDLTPDDPDWTPGRRRDDDWNAVVRADDWPLGVVAAHDPGAVRSALVGVAESAAETPSNASDLRTMLVEAGDPAVAVPAVEALVEGFGEGYALAPVPEALADLAGERPDLVAPVADSLLAELEATDGEAAAELARCLGAVGASDPGPTERIVDRATALLAAGHEDRSAAAADVLADVAESRPAAVAPSVPAVAGAIDGPARDGAVRCLDAVASADPGAVAPVVEDLVDSLSAPDEAVRRDAAVALARIGREGDETPAVARTVGEALSDPVAVLEEGRSPLAELAAGAPEVVDDALAGLVGEVYRWTMADLLRDAADRNPAAVESTVDRLGGAVREEGAEYEAYVLARVATDFPELVAPYWWSMVLAVESGGFGGEWSSDSPRVVLNGVQSIHDAAHVDPGDGAVIPADLRWADPYLSLVGEFEDPYGEAFEFLASLVDPDLPAFRSAVALYCPHLCRTVAIEVGADRFVD